MRSALGSCFGKDVVEVCVVGLGNLAHVFCGVVGSRDDVNVRALGVRAGRAAEFAALVKGGGPVVGLPASMGGGEVKGRVAVVSDDPGVVVAGADVVVLCTPSHIEPALLPQLAPHLKDGCVVVAVPGPGGFHWAARSSLSSTTKAAGLASIPWMSKADVFGVKARALGKKTVTGVACVRRDDAEFVAAALTALFDLPVVDVGGFLPIILNPANQLLHPCILWDLTIDQRRPWSEAPLFYESVSDRAASLLQETSDELMAIRDALQARLPDAWLGAVMPIADAIVAAYGDDVVDTGSLRAIVASNRAYAGIRTPVVDVDGGKEANFASRFLTEDIPFGLVVVRGVADLVDVKTPAIDRLIRWGQAKLGKRYLDDDGRLAGADLGESGAPARYGVVRVEDLG